MDEYRLSNTDFSELEAYILHYGTARKVAKKEYLLKQGEKNCFVGFVSKGMFRHVRVDSMGNEHVMGYSLEREFVGDYTANLCAREALIGIQAMTDAVVYCVAYHEIKSFWERSLDTQRLGRIVAEQLFVLSYRRLLESYCCTPEERYVDFMKHYPDVKELIPLKEIASFIGVRPETVSNIRRKLLEKS